MYLYVYVSMYIYVHVCMCVCVCVIGMKSVNLYIEMFSMGAWKAVIISVNIVCVGQYGDSGSVPCEWYISISRLYDRFIGGN